MRNCQTLIDDIRSTFATNESVPPDQFRMLAEEYNNACQEMIQRLKTCTSYLRSGNTAEAVRLAEVEPNLLDVYNLLDFPEREEWGYILGTFNYKVPPPFPHELALQLNDAYNQMMSLEPLLKKYRILGLARAPLAERLSVLRAIATSDPTNPVWLKDQETFEHERLKSLPKEVETALTAGRYDLMQRLQHELKQHWCVAIPLDLAEKLSVAMRGLHFQSIRKQLEKLVEQLINAHAKKDKGQGFALLTNLQMIVNESGMAVPTDLSDTAEPAVQWLSNEKKKQKLLQKYESVLNEIKQAFQHDTRPEELSKLYNALSIRANEACVEVPAEIQAMYQNELQTHEIKTQSKKRRNIMLAATFALLAMAVIGVAMFLVAENRRVASTITRLNLYLQSNDFENAEPFLQKVSSSQKLIDVPEIARLHAELQEKIDNDKKQHSLFLESFNTAKVSIEKNQLDLNAFDQANKLAKRQDEKQLLETIRIHFDSHRTATQEKIDSDFSEALTQHSKNSMAIQRDMALSLTERQTKLQSIANDIKQMMHASKPSVSLVQRAEKLAATLEQTVQKFDQERVQTDALKTLTIAVGNAQKYETALSDYVRHFSDHAESSDFRVVASETDAWSRLLESTALQDDLTQILAHDDKENIAAEHALTLYNERFSTIKNFISSDAKKFIIPYLASTKNRTADPLAELKPFEGTKAILKELTQKEVWPIYKSPTNAWYYLTQEPQGKGVYQHVNSFYSDAKSKNFDDSYFVGIPKINQYQYAIAALKALDEIQTKTWAETCYLQIQKLYAADGIDPILKLTLMKEMINEMSKTDSVFGERFRPVSTLLETATIDFYSAPNWMNGESIINDPTRDQCKAILSRMTLPSPEEMKSAYTRINTLLSEQMKPYQWIGFLAKNNQSGEWVLMASGKSFPAGELTVIRKISAGQSGIDDKNFQCQILPCGMIGEDAKVTIENAPYLLQGLPVFVKSK